MSDSGVMKRGRRKRSSSSSSSSPSTSSSSTNNSFPVVFELDSPRPTGNTPIITPIVERNNSSGIGSDRIGSSNSSCSSSNSTTTATTTSVTTSHKTGTVERWTVRDKSEVRKGQVVAQIRLYQRTLVDVKAGTDGLLYREVQSGSSVTEGQSLGRIDTCLHEVHYAGMCATCGIDLTHAHFSREKTRAHQISVLHAIPAVTVSQNMAATLDQETTTRLKNSNKLALVLDLDHTLLHATTDAWVPRYFDSIRTHADARAEISAARMEKRQKTTDTSPDCNDEVDDGGDDTTPRDRDSDSSSCGSIGGGDQCDEGGGKNSPERVWQIMNEGTYCFDLKSAGHNKQRYFVRLRPGLREFLRECAPLFELHIYTMGTASYAKCVRDIIDPSHTLFQNRILSRDSVSFDKGPANHKTIRRIFPEDDRMVIVIDDRVDVWRTCKNVIKIHPFRFFSGVTEVNALPGDKSSDKRQPAVKADAITKEIETKGSGAGTEAGGAEAAERTPADALTDTTDTPTTTVEALPEAPSTAITGTTAAEAASPPSFEAEQVSNAAIKGTGNNVADGDDCSDGDEGTSEEERMDTCGDEIVYGDDDDGPSCPSPVLPASSSPPSTTTIREKIVRSMPICHDTALYDNHLEMWLANLKAVHATFFETDTAASDDSTASSSTTTTTTTTTATATATASTSDVKRIMIDMRSRVFEGFYFAFSGVFPIGAKPSTTKLWKLCEAFGAICHIELSDNITHLIACRAFTEKVNKCRKKRKNVVVVHLEWLMVCCDTWKRHPAADYPLDLTAPPHLTSSSSKTTKPTTEASKISSTKTTPALATAANAAATGAAASAATKPASETPEPKEKEERKNGEVVRSSADKALDILCDRKLVEANRTRRTPEQCEKHASQLYMLYVMEDVVLTKKKATTNGGSAGSDNDDESSAKKRRHPRDDIDVDGEVGEDRVADGRLGEGDVEDGRKRRRFTLDDRSIDVDEDDDDDDDDDDDSVSGGSCNGSEGYGSSDDDLVDMLEMDDDDDDDE